MKIGLITGSSRKESFNRKILSHIKENFDGASMEFIDISQLPIYNQDIEMDEIKEVSRLRQEIKEVDGLIIATPEHNGHTSAVLKNFLDWMSRVETVLVDKPTMLISSSISPWGGLRARENLESIISSPYVGNKLIEGTALSIKEVQNALDDQGRLIDQELIQEIEGAMEIFLANVK